jgi:hypothetical protein
LKISNRACMHLPEVWQKNISTYVKIHLYKRNIEIQYRLKI